MREEVIKIDYPGSVISVNHYKYAGGKYTRKETKIWMDELGWLIKHLHIEDWKLPLAVTCDGYFKDERSAPDVHNLFKVIADSIQEATGVDDKNYDMKSGKRVIGEKHPYLLITIRENKRR